MRKVIIFCSILLAVGFMSSTATASLINTDLSIEANVTFDTGASVPTTGNANQSADMTRVIGGTSSSSSVINVTPSGGNPYGGGLTNYGDGIGVNALASSTAGALSEVGGFVFDFSFSLQNNSLLDTHKVFFELDFSNFANAEGADAFVDSEINLFDSLNNEMFFSDLTSDSKIGDEKNGVGLSSFGATLLDNGKFLFDITLAAGVLDSFSAVLKMDGEDFTNDSFFTGQSDVFIRIVDSENLTSSTPSTPVPEPSSIFLFAVVMMLVQIKRRIIS